MNAINTTAETALQNLINEAIESGRANAGNIEARVYNGRVRLFVDGARANKAQVLEVLAEVMQPVTVEEADPVTDNVRHAQLLADNTATRKAFRKDVKAAMREHPEGITAWSLHKIMTTVFGWTGFAQRSPELSANLFNKLSQESGLVRYVPTQRGSRTVYTAQLV